MEDMTYSFSAVPGCGGGVYVESGYIYMTDNVNGATVADNTAENSGGGIFADSASMQIPDGFTLTLLVLHDDNDYGIGKDGNPRENNEFQTFEVTVLSRDHPVKKGDFIRLLDFDPDHSYARMLQGFPLVAFDMEKLREFDPEGVETVETTWRELGLYNPPPQGRTAEKIRRKD